MKTFYKTVLLLSFLLLNLTADETKVKITKDISSIKVKHLGQTIEIKRIQDPYHELRDDYTKTSRPCPPFLHTSNESSTWHKNDR